VGRFGFCYVADSDAYIDEAMVSIASLKACMPDAAVSLVTHRKLFRPSELVSDWVELRQHRTGPIVKTDARLAPYERVVFLDTDTLVIGDLSDVFPLLDRFDLAFAVEPNGRPDYGTSAGVPVAFPEPNSGFLALRNSPEIERFFGEWLTEYDTLRKRGVTNDQPALRNALWKSPVIRGVTLGSEYNLIVHASPGVSGAVKVIHDRSPDRARVAATANRHIEPRAVVAGFGPVFGFITRRGWVRQYLRLSWNFLRVLLRPGRIRQQGHPAVWWRDGVD
jgi:hypothetical protein